MLFLIILVLICDNLVDASRILCVYPYPAFSHQQVFRVLTDALLERGHQLTVITPYPAYKENNRPQNLSEVDTSHIIEHVEKGAEEGSKTSQEWFYDSTLSNPNSHWLTNQAFTTFNFNKEIESYTKGNNEAFDLIIVEDLYDHGMVLSEVLNAPMITFRMFCETFNSYEAVGAPASHPLLYPTIYRLILDYSSFIDKFYETHMEYMLGEVFSYINYIVRHLKTNLGIETKAFEELQNNKDVLFVNMHSIFEGNSPMPINVVHTNFLHLVEKTECDLPKNLKQFLDNATSGVIYVSFESYFSPANMYPDHLEILMAGFELLPYDIVWRFDGELPRKVNNLHTNKWFPQTDLLRHPNVKAFVTQGGLQSTDEAINAGVPLICIPMFADQWFNAENYLRLGIGVKLDFMALTVQDLVEGVQEVASNKSYLENIVRLRTLMNDQPQTPLERAVWWTEYVIRHKGAKHLESPAANVPLDEYFHVDLFLFLGTIFVLSLALFCYFNVKLYQVLSKIRSIFKNDDHC